MRVVLLCGAPAVGKTTVMRRLRCEVMGPATFIEVDNVWDMQTPTDWSSARQYEVTIKATAALAVSLFDSTDATTVIAAPFTWVHRDMMRDALVMRSRAPVMLQYVLLAARPSVLRERMAARDSSAYHNIVEALKVNDEHRQRSHIDTSDMSAEHTASTVASMLRGAW